MPSQGPSLSAHEIFRLISEIRRTKPLVHNITNYVAMNFTANALLAVGASPVMAHAPEEIEDMVRMAKAVVINMGTLDNFFVASAKRAIQIAADLGRPVVFDPVGVGASNFRSQVAKEFVDLAPISVIRGNASEILALNGAKAQTKGVDSQYASSVARFAATELAKRYHCVVCVSGAIDFIVDQETTVTIQNGHSLMARVTAMGCAASSLIGAFVGASETTAFQATQAAMATISIAGEMAAEKSLGPGSCQMELLDALHRIDIEDLRRRLRLSAGL